LQIADCGLQIETELAIKPSEHSAIRNLQSAILDGSKFKVAGLHP